jgi:hypothetical protein
LCGLFGVACLAWLAGGWLACGWLVGLFASLVKKVCILFLNLYYSSSSLSSSSSL